MDKIAIWIASIFSDKGVHDAKAAWRIIWTIVIVVLLALWMRELVRHDPLAARDIPSNALAQ